MFCECGCGQRTNIAPLTNRKYGHVKGQPYRFIFGHHRRNHGQPPLVRFNQKVIIDPISGCWPWTAQKLRWGHGAFSLDGRTPMLAGRASWLLHRGPIPDGLFVLHCCPGGDNSSCVNPDHLYLGTQKDNMRDRDRQGRGVFSHPGHAPWNKGRRKWAKPSSSDPSPEAKLRQR